MAGREHVVILGGGFGGWYAARYLAWLLPREHRITLVDRVPHMLYTPMLTEVAGGSVEGASVAVPMGMLPSRVAFVRGDIAGVDVPAKTLRLADGTILTATQLVLALGSTTSYHGIEGAEANSIPLKTLNHANELRGRVDGMVEAAMAAGADAEDRQKSLTLAVAGGGYTGVETMAALNRRLRKAAAGAGIDAGEINAVLIEPTKRLMGEMPEDLAAYGQKEIEASGVRVMTGVGVKEVKGDTVVLTSGEEIRAGLLVWDTGIEPSPLLKDVAVPKGKHHGVVVDGCFRVQGCEGVWAIGDCAEIPEPEGGGTYAPTAQNAVREGRQLAKNIAMTLRGSAPQPFRYKMLGQLALLSGGKAVAMVLGVKVRGLLAWAMWWVIYTAKLPGIATRAGVVRSLALGNGRRGQLTIEGSVAEARGREAQARA